MAQEQLSLSEINLEVKMSDKSSKRKINFKIDAIHNLSIFKNDLGETTINIRRGTRSVSVSKEMWIELCNLKESVLLCASFIDSE